MRKLYGYSFRAASAPFTADGQPAWHALVRRKGWQRSYWVTVKSDYGPIIYTTREYALAAARWWAERNETRIDAGDTQAIRTSHAEA